MRVKSPLFLFCPSPFIAFLGQIYLSIFYHFRFFDMDYFVYFLYFCSVLLNIKKCKNGQNKKRNASWQIEIEISKQGL